LPRRDNEKLWGGMVLAVPHQRRDNGYGRNEKAKTISAENPARYFPASDELLYGPILGRKISDLIASFESAV
jgi:hypothetical protein